MKQSWPALLRKRSQLMQQFKLPDLGEGLQEAEVIEWLVKEGDQVKTDQLLVLVETAKAVVELPSPIDAKISKLCASVGDMVHIGEPLVEYEGDEYKKKSPSSNQSVSVVGELQTSDDVNLDENFIAGSSTSVNTIERKLNTTSQNSVYAPPSIIAFAKKLGVEQELKQSFFGDLTHKDLIKIFEEKYQLDKGGDAKQADFDNKLIKLTGAKKVMAQTMSKSWQQVPAVTLFDDADISGWGIKDDITLRLLQALIKACKANPLFNAWFDEENLTIQTFKDINIGVAVNIDDGLYVPVIKKAQDLTNKEVKHQLSSLIEQVKTKKIPPQKFLGATISLSNFGTLSGRYATPIVVPPQVAIVGVGKIREEAVVRDNSVVIGRILPISLSFDHRAASGADASAFLEEFIAEVQQ